jgi:peptidoglycan/xylan/chitin deacetylase (PgdA/CDA1 family)
MNRFAPGALILAYHRVAEPPADPQLLCVTPEHFAQQLDVLRGWGRPLRLQELRAALAAGRVPDRAVVVTFDDGYADNLYAAEPLLLSRDVPATVFVTAGCLGSQEEFWWDDLERLLLQPGPLPEVLQLRLEGRTHAWTLREDGRASRTWPRAWSVLEPEEPSPRHAAYRALCRLLRDLPSSRRTQALQAVRAWAGASAEGRPSHRVLAPDEVARLAAGGLVEIGSHTLTHPVLARLDPVEQRVELQASKAQLEAILGRPVLSLAYPFGSPADYGPETMAAARDCGFAAACANFPAAVRRGSDLWQLPRLLVRNWNGDEFGRRLEDWLRA